jgi:hypothetical protein
MDANKLNTVDGWKALHGGGLFGGKAKKSLASWQSAKDKGVAKLHTLRQEEYEGRHYAIYAFSTKGELGDAEVKKLASAVAEMPLGDIRYQATGSPEFCSMHLFWHSDKNNEQSERFNETSINLSDPGRGVFVMIEAAGDQARLDAPYVAWGRNDDYLMTYTIPASAKL